MHRHVRVRHASATSDGFVDGPCHLSVSIHPRALSGQSTLSGRCCWSPSRARVLHGRVGTRRYTRCRAHVSKTSFAGVAAPRSFWTTLISLSSSFLSYRPIASSRRRTGQILHGAQSLFPSSLSMASSWDATLSRRRCKRSTRSCGARAARCSPRASLRSTHTTGTCLRTTMVLRPCFAR